MTYLLLKINFCQSRKIYQHLGHATEYVPNSENVPTNMLPTCGKHDVTHQEPGKAAVDM